jgi:hypothetical protein
LEANAGRVLEEWDARNPGAHGHKRHGATTTLPDQRKRAATGISPDHVFGAPVGRPEDSTRFLSSRDQLALRVRAATIHQRATTTNQVIFVSPSIVGEGYLRGGAFNLQGVTRYSTVNFDHNAGFIYSDFPLLRLPPNARPVRF